MTNNFETLIDINNLTKKYKNFVAVDSINLKIRKGELFGLLGPNGAGKTTIINMLATISKPSSGKVHIQGIDLQDQNNIRKKIGIIFQDPSLDDELTAREHLDFHGRLYHMPKTTRRERISEILQLMDLDTKKDLQVKTFSGGMKRRLEIARGLMHKPNILFLDEPTIGLDPQTRRIIWEHIKNLIHRQKVTIILTTHYMEEADYLCDRIAIIDHGKIIAMDTPDNLKNVLLEDKIILIISDVKKLQQLLSHLSWIKHIESFPNENKIIIKVDNYEKNIPVILKIATTNDITIDSVKIEKNTLEDVFLYYTGRKIREEKVSPEDIMRNLIRVYKKRN
ncbi:MAG: ATP-binding cassette domain-containing protein [Nitrososphaeraceae archaeon]